MDNICPYAIEEKITCNNVNNICEEICLNIITSAQEFANDINVYYEGYLHNKRLASNITNKQKYDAFEKIEKDAKKLINHINDIISYMDNSLKLDLEIRLYLSETARKKSKATSIQDVLNVLEALKEEASRQFNGQNTISFGVTPQQWFIGEVLPELYKKHTGCEHSRSYNADTKSKGKPQMFLEEVLKYFDDFSTMTDSAIDSALANYKNKKKTKNKEFKWPYHWTDFTYIPPKKDG